MSDGDTPTRLYPGDTVRDREDDNSVLLVVATPVERADEYPASGAETVADLNPDYPADDRVLECIYPDGARADIDAYRRYAFPRSRLRRVHTPREEGGDE